MLIGLLLGLATPSPPPFAGLRTIATVRATPVCTALRTHVAPAISNLLDGDDQISAADAFFAGAGARAGPGTRLRALSHVTDLEYGITPIVDDMESAQSQLDQLSAGGSLAPVRQTLEDVIRRQNDALNAMTGYLYSGDLSALRSAEPESMLRALGPEIVFHYPVAPLPAARGRYPEVSLYSLAGTQFFQARKAIDAAEQAASQAVYSVIARCGQTSTP